MKPLYKIKLGSTPVFRYYDYHTGKKRGTWDVYAVTHKETSAMPREFYNITQQFIAQGRENHGRKIWAIMTNVYLAGQRIGWKCSRQDELILWSARNKHGHMCDVFAFAALHCRWRKEPSMAKELLQSKAWLRFVIDNSGRSVISPMPKRMVITDV